MLKASINKLTLNYNMMTFIVLTRTYAVKFTAVVVFLSLIFAFNAFNHVQASERSPLSFEAIYQKTFELTSDDEKRVRLLQGALSQQNVDYKDVSVAIRGGQARFAWQYTQVSKMAKPSDKAMQSLRKAMPEMADYYDNHSTITIKKKEVIVWNTLKNKKLRTVEKISQSYDLESKSDKTTSSKKQKIVKSQPKYCDSLQTYDFHFPQIESPCQTKKWIDRKFRVATGRKETLSLMFKDKTGAGFKLKPITCEYYGVESSRSDVSLGAKLSGTCVSFIKNIPIVVIEESHGMSEANMDSESVLRYELRSLDLSPEFTDNYFDFANNSLCKNNGEKTTAWVKCKSVN